jgi:hypothetical protein
MQKQFGVFNQFSGLYEKFETIDLAVSRQQELLDKWTNDARNLFGLTVYKINENKDVIQLPCDEQGNTIQAKLEELGIFSNWFYLPIRTGKWGSAFVNSVHASIELPIGSRPVYIGSDAAPWWMSNDHTYLNGIGGLRSQYYNAKGRVLLGGLGLGLLTLLISSKQEVTEVVVCEINPDVIEAFRINGWNEDKITIIDSPIQEYTDSAGFDYILLDHVNQSDLSLYKAYQQDILTITKNVGSPKEAFDCYTWEELYFWWLKAEGKIHSRQSYLEFASPLRLPTYDQDILNDYLLFYDPDSRGAITPIDPYLSQQIEKVWLNLGLNRQV